MLNIFIAESILKQVIESEGTIRQALHRDYPINMEILSQRLFLCSQR